MEQIMAVLTKEKLYSERLCKYLNFKRRMNMTAVSFDNLEELRDFEKRHRISVILSDKEIYKAQEADIGRGYGDTEKEVFLLSEDKADNGCIYKYQPADDILSDIMLKTKNTVFSSVYSSMKREPVVIGVYSPSIQSFKTAFSVTLCRILQKYKRTLYISLEEFSDVMMIKESEGRYSLSDAMYQYRQGELDQNKILSMIEHYEDFEYIQPMKTIDSIDIMRGEEYVELIECILKNSDYEAIVVDLPVYLGIASDIMDICTSVYVYMGKDFLAKYKLDEFDNYIEKSDKLFLREKIKKINPPEVMSVQRINYFDNLVYGELGDYIRENISEVVS
ncbi:MAG: hypothetical protein Q4B86_00380 [Eubacteriales bacterium]|nr:hypothetical protein [Eubacteriales bacterium]